MSQNNDYMHKKIMLEFPDGSRRWGTATTMHSQSSYGQPVITCGDDVYKSGDIILSEIIIICNDPEAVRELKKAGYNPISRVRKDNQYAVYIDDKLTELVQKDAESNNQTVSNQIVTILRAHYGKE